MVIMVPVENFLVLVLKTQYHREGKIILCTSTNPLCSCASQQSWPLKAPGYFHLVEKGSVYLLRISLAAESKLDYLYYCNSDSETVGVFCIKNLII